MKLGREKGRADYLSRLGKKWTSKVGNQLKAAVFIRSGNRKMNLDFEEMNPVVSDPWHKVK